MSLLDPAERRARGIAQQAVLTAAPAPEPATLFESSWCDYVFAEIWPRPGLDLRSRYMIALASAACAQDGAAARDYARGGLDRAAMTLAELREAALHIAVYGGWRSGAVLDQAITGAAEDLALPPAPIDPIRDAPWDPATRRAEGKANFASVMCFPGGGANSAYSEGGIYDFVFGEMWRRPGLDQRARRWLTLVGVAHSSSVIPIRSHVWAAMASEDATADEMFEFVLQYAVHAGWPRASVMQQAVTEQADRVARGLSFNE